MLCTLQVYAVLEALNKRRGRFGKADVLAMQAIGHRVRGGKRTPRATVPGSMRVFRVLLKVLIRF